MTNYHYGGFWRRLLAFIIDKAIVYALCLSFSLILLLAVGLGSDILTITASPLEKISHGAGAFAFLSVFLSIIIDMTYFTWFHGISGQTPGKMLLRLRVIGANGEPITPGTAFLRWTGYLLSGIVFFSGFLWIAFDRRKQGWHDKIALTLVVRINKVPAPFPSEYPDLSSSPSPASPSGTIISDVPSSDETSETGASTDGKYQTPASQAEKWLDKPGEIL
jgi:uncharacterized RDD family membrane protein YckC